MTISRLRAAITLAAASSLLLVLTSCAPATGGGSGGGSGAGSGSGENGGTASSATPTPTPTPTVSSLNLTAPSPLVNIPCSKFATPAQIHSTYGSAPVVALATAAIATGDLQAQDTQIPAMDYVRQAGGIACVWSDKPTNFYTGTGSSFPHEHATQVGVLFNAAAAWHNEEIVDGFPGPMSAGSCDIGSCQLDQLFSGKTWFDATELNQVPAGDKFGDLTDQGKAAILAGGVAGAIPTPDAGTLPLGSTCADFVTPAQVSTALGGTAVVSVQPLLPHDDFDTYGIWNGAQDELKDHPCYWKHGTAAVAHLSWLPGGAWAWNEAKVLPLKDGPVAPLAITGLADGDTAFIRCAASDASCVADLVIGGNWISVQVGQSGSTNRAAVTAIATAIVTKLG